MELKQKMKCALLLFSGRAAAASNSEHRSWESVPDRNGRLRRRLRRSFVVRSKRDRHLGFFLSRSSAVNTVEDRRMKSVFRVTVYDAHRVHIIL